MLFTAPSGDRAARVAATVGSPALTGSGHVIGEREHLLVSTIARDQVGEPVSAVAPAFQALDAKQVELADQVGEDDRAIAGPAH
jgi:hypothetical protein